MGAPSKRARKVRSESEFDLIRLSAELRPPRASPDAYSWSLADIVRARREQMAGRFKLPARMAESMRTDDAIAVPQENRLAPQQCIDVELEPAKGARGRSVADEAEGLFGRNGVGIHPDTITDVNGCLVDHGLAVGYNVTTPRPDGSRVDVEMKAWPIEFVRWDPIDRCLKAQVDPMGQPAYIPGPTNVDGERQAYQSVNFWEEPIVHGDGRWVVFQKRSLYPWRDSAAILAASLVWSRHAFAISDWARGSRAHGNPKIIGEMPEGVPLQGPDGKASPEAAAFLELMRALMSSDLPIGIRPSGAKTDFSEFTSSAWQVWDALVTNAEKAGARIYLGTDGTLGTQGGAPGVDIGKLFGVATTKVEGDLRCIQRGIDTGVIEPWCAMNHGDSLLAPRRRYQIPNDADKEARRDSIAKRRTAFYADIKAARDNGFEVTQEYVDDVAEAYDVAAPNLLTVSANGPSTTLTTKDVAGAVLTVNEARASAGVGPLLLEDGTQDPKGAMTVGEFNAKIIAPTDVSTAGADSADSDSDPPAAIPAAAE